MTRSAGSPSIGSDRARPAGITAHKVRGGIELLECLDGQETAILIDAAAPAGRPGTIRSFVWPCPELAAVLPWSTHGLGLVEALHLAESLGQLPRKVFIYTIETSHISAGVPLELGRRIAARSDVGGRAGACCERRARAVASPGVKPAASSGQEVRHSRRAR